MKESLNLWLSRNARLPGVLACGLRYPDRTVFTQSWAPGCSAAALENAMRCLTDTFQVMLLNRLPISRICWTFEQSHLFCTRREDGSCIGILTTKDPKIFAAAEIDRLLNEFHHIYPYAM